MGMNSQPPIPPCPVYPRLLISPWILQLAYSLYPLVTRGHPPHCGEIQPAYTRHGQPYPQPSLPPPPPLHPLPCAPTPPPQWPSLSANYLDSCCVPLPPPPPAILTPLSHFFLFTFPLRHPRLGSLLLFILSPTYLLYHAPLYFPFSYCNSSVCIVPSECMAGGQIFSLPPPPPQPPATTPNQSEFTRTWRER